jgi:hypothetical protein
MGFNGPPKLTESYVQRVLSGVAWYHANPFQKNMRPLPPTAQPLPLPIPLVPPFIMKTPFRFDVGIVVYSVGLSNLHAPLDAEVGCNDTDTRTRMDKATRTRPPRFPDFIL